MGTHTQDIEIVEAPAAHKKKPTVRLPFLDWTRGLAATIMLQGHVFHSFIRTDCATAARMSSPNLLVGSLLLFFSFLPA